MPATSSGPAGATRSNFCADGATRDRDGQATARRAKVRPLDLSRARAILYGWAFLAAQAIVLVYLILKSHGVIGGAASDASTDFMMIYASGKLALSGAPDQVYDLARQLTTQQAIFGGRLEGYFPFYYPPIYLLVCAALASLPYFAGFGVWIAATGALLASLLWRVTRDWRLTVALFSFPAAIVNAGLGQNAFLTAALLGYGMLLVDRSPWIGGAILGGLAFKPHFLVLAPIVLLAGGRWRALAGMALSGTVLAAISAAFFGIEPWRAFLDHLATAGAIYGGGELGYWAQTSVFAAIRLLGGGYGLALAVHLAAAAIVAVLAARAWWRDDDLAVRAPLLIAGTLICLPVNLSYDLMAFVAGVAFLCRPGAAPLRAWEKSLLAADWVVMLVGRDIAATWGVPLLPLVAISLFAIALNRGAALPARA